MSSHSTVSGGESRAISPSARPTEAYQPLSTTPAVPTMKSKFQTNLSRHLESMGVLAAVESEEEEEQVAGTDEETEDGEDVKEGISPVLKHRQADEEESAMPPRASWTLAPPKEARGEVAPPERIPSPKIRVPGRIWNEVIAETAAAARKGKRSKRGRFDSILAEAEAEQDEREALDPVPKSIKRRRTGDVGKSSRTREATGSRVGGGGAAAGSNEPPPPTQNPYARQYSKHSRRASPLLHSAPTIAAAAANKKGKGKARAKPAPAPAPEPVPTPIPSPSEEGPRATWRRLFPHLNCEMNNYKGVPDAWHELMLWEKGVGWRARLPSEPYVKKTLGGIVFLRTWARKRWGTESEMQGEYNRARQEAECERIVRLKSVESREPLAGPQPTAK